MYRLNAVQHRNREHGIDAQSHAGQLRRRSLFFGHGGHQAQSLLLVRPEINQTLNAMAKIAQVLGIKDVIASQNKKCCNATSEESEARL
jgi:hypothetical protein